MIMATPWRKLLRCGTVGSFIVLMVVCVFLVFLTYIYIDDDRTRMVGPMSYVKVLGPRVMSERTQKRVLLWTKAWGEDWTRVVSFKDCPMSQCDVTSARSELKNSDAVVFHLSNLDPGDLPLTRHAHQAWVFYNMESPCATVANFRSVEDHFNWTMSYRRDADVFAPYGWAVARSAGDQANMGRPWASKNRSKLAVWVASNCWDISGRQEVVKELSRHMPVDTFGACGQQKLPEACGRYGDTFCPHLLGDYKFYLAFENAVCRDYVTEKVWNALKRDQVPVVLGGDVQYDRLLPPNSYISVSQFPDIATLAQYLLYLDSHPEEYNRYLSWKSQYTPMDNFHWCSLCAVLHDSSKPSQVYTALEKWAYSDVATCRCSSVKNRIRKWFPYL